MHFNFSQMEIVSEPFPYVIIENFLEENDLENLLKEFPKVTSSFQNVMGGRARLASDESEFYEFIKNNEAWGNFYCALNSKAFVEEVINVFSDKIDNYNPVANFKALAFDCDFLRKKASSDFLRNLDKRQLHSISSSELLKAVLFRVFKKVRSTIRFNNFLAKKELYLHLDISEASVGYEREIHHDSDNRLAAFTFYLSDQNSTQGGEFAIHEYINETPLERCAPHPEESEMKLSRLITPKKNTLVLFLSTPNSYHSVPVIKSLKSTRKFVYAGISSKASNVWAGVIRYKQ